MGQAIKKAKQKGKQPAHEAKKDDSASNAEQLQRDMVRQCDDLYVGPMERLKRLKGTVTLLAMIGSPEHECYDTEDILRFCELVEEEIKGSLEEIDTINKTVIALARKMAVA